MVTMVVHGCPIPNRLRAHEAQGAEANLLRITADPWEKQPDFSRERLNIYGSNFGSVGPTWQAYDFHYIMASFQDPSVIMLL